MARKLQLQISTPCHENWQEMTPTEKGRFCASCQKQVVDFSNKSDREIAMFFKKPSTGSTCGRFMNDQLNRDIEIPKKRIPWLKYFFRIAIPAFLASCDHRTQGKVKVTDTYIQPAKAKGTRIQEKCTTTTGLIIPEIVLGDTVLKGDISPEMISEVNTIRTFEPKHRKQKSTILPELKSPVSRDPLFTSPDIKAPVNDPITISEPFEITTKGAIALIVEPFGDVRCDSKGTSRTVPLLRKFFKDSASTKFRIYPNPIRSNSTLTIEWKQNQNGDHLVQLFNQSGQLILSKTIYIDEKSRLFNMDMPSIISGNYFLKLTSKTTGKSYTEKLVVE